MGHSYCPLIQIFSVYLSVEFDDGGQCEAHGSIRAIQGQGTSLALYDQDLADCETTSKHGALSLTGPEGYAILGSKGITVRLNQKDWIRAIELIKGCHYLDSIREDCYDKLMKAVFQGEHGCVYLYYNTFQFAISAVVEVVIVNKYKGSGRFDDVYGSIDANYMNNNQFRRSME